MVLGLEDRDEWLDLLFLQEKDSMESSVGGTQWDASGRLMQWCHRLRSGQWGQREMVSCRVYFGGPDVKTQRD